MNVLGLDAYAWLVLILTGITGGLLFITLWLARAYNEAKSRLHVISTDSISAYLKITEAMNYIRQDLNNFTSVTTRGNDTTHKIIENRLDKIDRALEELQRDVLRK